jgi:hypothetical protein
MFGAGVVSQVLLGSRLPELLVIRVFPDFDFIRQDGQLDCLHREVLRQLLGVVREGAPSQDDIAVKDYHPKLADSTPQPITEQSLDLFR